MSNRFYFLGDSHVGCLKQAAEEFGITAAGIGVMNGTKWHEAAFEWSPDGNFHFFSEIDQHRYRWFKEQTEASSLFDVDKPLVLSIGFHTRAALSDLLDSHSVMQQSPGRHFLSSGAAQAWISDVRCKHLHVLAKLVENRKRVYVFSPPQRDHDQAAAQLFESYVAKAMRGIGVTVIDTREFAVDHEGKLLQEFHANDPNDKAHANSRFGKFVIERVLG